MNSIIYSLDSFYLVVMGILVMFMAAGFSMLEAGLVRKKNTVEILTKNIMLFAISCIVFYIMGYHLAYLTEGNILNSLGFFIGSENDASILTGEISNIHSVGSDYFFQTMFAATCVSIVSGAVAERFKLSLFLIFSIILTLLYSIIVNWTWGGGWLSGLGYYDFAGSGIVHLTGASAALAGVIILKPRIGKYKANGSINPILGCNIPLSVIGMFILWFGWFGFNGGSQLTLYNLENVNSFSNVLVNTLLAGCGGAIGSYIFSLYKYKKIDITFLVNGCLSGLVSITADPANPSGLLAIMIGFVGGVICAISILILDRKLKLDDPVGSISVHGAAGLFGVLVIPLSNPNSNFLSQLIGGFSIFIFIFITVYIVLIILNKINPIRVSEKTEYDGLDISECGLEAYPEFKNNS